MNRKMLIGSCLCHVYYKIVMQMMAHIDPKDELSIFIVETWLISSLLHQSVYKESMNAEWPIYINVML
jgi:hypothetical protein